MRFGCCSVCSGGFALWSCSGWVIGHCADRPEPVLAEVAHLRRADERRGRGRNEHLSAVTGGGDARRAVDVRSDVALFRQQGSAGVKPHPYRQVQLLLCLARGRKRARRDRKTDEEGVATRTTAAWWTVLCASNMVSWLPPGDPARRDDVCALGGPAAPARGGEVGHECHGGDCLGSERDHDRGSVAVLLEAEQRVMLADEQKHERRRR